MSDNLRQFLTKAVSFSPENKNKKHDQLTKQPQPTTTTTTKQPVLTQTINFIKQK